MQRTQDQNKFVLFEEHKYKQLLESKGSLTPSIILSPCLKYQTGCLFQQSTNLICSRAEVSSSVGGFLFQSSLYPLLCWVCCAGPLKSVSRLGGDLNPSTQ